MSKLKELEITNSEVAKLNDNQFGLVMAHLFGETYRELAFNFNIPIGTAKSRLSRATAKLLENRRNAATDNINS